MAFEGFPFIVGWELTLACNLRCRHCGSSAAAPRPEELTLEECRSVCDQMPALLVQEVDFTGGEPLLRPDWWQIAGYLRDLGIGTKILTNGLLLTPDTVARLLDVGIAGVGVSVDGIEPIHDYIRGRPGLFRQLASGIERVRRAGLPVTVITTVNALNLETLPDLFACLRSWGVTAWQVQPIFPLGRGQSSADLQLSLPSYWKLGAFVRDWGPRVEAAGIALLPGDSFGYFTDVDTRQPRFGGCPAGRMACGITSDGKVKGCLSMPDHLVEGDLRLDDLWEIWFRPDAFVYNRDRAPDELGPHCDGCDQGTVCRGGCSAMSVGATGRLHNDPYCFLAIERSHGLAAQPQDRCKGPLSSPAGYTELAPS